MSGESGSGVAVRKVVSGGQTGVDRAALDVARELAIPCGGWCPRGRRAEDGPIPESYLLQETPSAAYPERTAWNVRDSDGTLVVARGRPRGGTALTVSIARRAAKPVMVANLEGGASVSEIRKFILSNEIRVLNVAGPRESEAPGIHDQAAALLREVLSKNDSKPLPGPG
jgi:hypothetical protein